MRSLSILVCLSACATAPGTTTVASSTHDASSNAPPVSAACRAAREMRAKAVELDTEGHVRKALAKIAEADAACATESGSSAALATTIRAMLAPADASKGTEATARAKMHEAFVAERTDRAKAKTLYLEAWAEQHPNPRALEDAARMADGAESRRLRDRALSEAEALEKTPATVTTRIHTSTGHARLLGATLLVGNDGKVAAFDTKTNEMRVMVDSPGAAFTRTRISPGGTIAVSGPSTPANVTVFDVTTGSALFKIAGVRKIAFAPDDSAIAVIDDRDGADSMQYARVFDVATGQVKSKLSGKWRSQSYLAFAPDAKHVIVYGDDQDTVIRQWDVEKNAYTSLRLDSLYGQFGTSPDGHYLAYLETLVDPVPLHVRDMLTNKEVTKWNGSFHSVAALAVTNDGKMLATGSRNSLRLWDVAQKKQMFKHESSSAEATDDDEDFAFDDESKTMLVGGSSPTAWDVATGKETVLVPYQRDLNVLRVVKSPDGVAVILEDEVRLVPKTGEPRTVCKGLYQPYAPVIGPTNVAFSASGKTFACGMSDGWVHVFDTSTWAENAVVKRGAESPIDRPVDLVLGDDALTIVANAGFVTYDAKTAKETKRVTFKSPMPLAPRHVRLDDGSIAVRTWTGSLAIFDKEGAYQREVKLGLNAPIASLDALSGDGKTYAAVVGKTLHQIDLATGEDHPSDLAFRPKTIAFVAGKASASADRVSTIGAAVYTANGATITTGALTIEIGTDGIVAREASSPESGKATGAFEVRGKPLAACAIGKTWLSTETCDDLAKEGLVASFTEQKTGT